MPGFLVVIAVICGTCVYFGGDFNLFTEFGIFVTGAIFALIAGQYLIAGVAGAVAVAWLFRGLFE